MMRFQEKKTITFSPLEVKVILENYVKEKLAVGSEWFFCDGASEPITHNVTVMLAKKKEEK